MFADNAAQCAATLNVSMGGNPPPVVVMGSNPPAVVLICNVLQH
jgi:hypothetical protein